MEDVLAAQDGFTHGADLCRFIGRRLLPGIAHGDHPARGVVAQLTDFTITQIVGAKSRRAIFLDQAAAFAHIHLRSIKLALERLDPLDLLRRHAIPFEMGMGGIQHLHFQRICAGVGHQVEIVRHPVFIERHGRPVLGVQGPDICRVLVHHVGQVRHRARATVDRDGRVAAIEAVFRIGVAAARIAHHFDIEFGLDDISLGVSRRPGNAYAEQAALQQQ